MLGGSAIAVATGGRLSVSSLRCLTSRCPTHGFQVGTVGFRRRSPASPWPARVFGRSPRRPGATVPRPDSARSERVGGNRRQATESGKSKGEGAQGCPSDKSRFMVRNVHDSHGRAAADSCSLTLPTSVAPPPSSSPPLKMAVCPSVALPVLYAGWVWDGIRIPTQ